MSDGVHLTADPEASHAVVVGIEKYASSDWDLSGPAFDALRTVRWLLNCHVPGPNIKVLLSPLDCHRSQLEAQATAPECEGVDVRWTARRD